MSSEMMPFEFEGSQVRVHVDEIGTPWWVAQDVCRVIGISNVSDAVGRLEMGEKRHHYGIGKTDNVLIINESGLYRLIFRSNKSEAKRFQNWVFGEVLPSIRKTGRYSIIENPPISVLEDKYTQAVSTMSMCKALGEFFETPKHTMMIEAKKELAKIGIDATPYLLASPAMDDIPSENEYLEPTELGRRWNMNGAEMNKALARLGLQARVNQEWIPTDNANGMCSKHAWSNGTKSGYNLKWNVAKVESLVNEYQLGALS